MPHRQSADSIQGRDAEGQGLTPAPSPPFVNLVEPGSQFLALGVIDGGGKALDQILELHAAQVELHR